MPYSYARERVSNTNSAFNIVMQSMGVSWFENQIILPVSMFVDYNESLNNLVDSKVHHCQNNLQLWNTSPLYCGKNAKLEAVLQVLFL